MKILIVRNDRLGDFITALPACYLLKSLDASHRITLLVAKMNEPLARACDFIDDVIVDEGESLFMLAEKIRKEQFDCSFTLFSDMRVALAQFLARIPVRYAPATKIAQILYTDRIVQRRSAVKMAEYEYNIALVRSRFNDLPHHIPTPLLHLRNDDYFQAFCRRYAIEKPVIALHPGYGGSSDANLTMREYFQLARIIAQSGRYTPVFTFGPGDERFLQEAKEHNTHNYLLYESTNGLIAFASLLAHFALFISTSTGTYHLAALVGTPTMTFFGDSLFASVKRWRAVSDISLQHPFMLPTDEQKRSEKFLEIQQSLQRITASI